MRRKIRTTAKKYHCGDNMLLHATSIKGEDRRAGAVFKYPAGYDVVCQGSNPPPHTTAHTYAWAKRLLWKHLKGGRW